MYGSLQEPGQWFSGTGFQEALALELSSQSVEFIEQPDINILYKGTILKQVYKPDFVCYDKIVVEIKAVSKLSDEHSAQLQNYLKATGYRLGLLVNFGHFPLIEKERIIR